MNNNNPSDNVNTDIWGRKIETPVSKKKKKNPKKWKN